MHKIRQTKQCNKNIVNNIRGSEKENFKYFLILTKNEIENSQRYLYCVKRQFETHEGKQALTNMEYGPL